MSECDSTHSEVVDIGDSHGQIGNTISAEIPFDHAYWLIDYQ